MSPTASATSRSASPRLGARRAASSSMASLRSRARMPETIGAHPAGLHEDRCARGGCADRCRDPCCAGVFRASVRPQEVRMARYVLLILDDPKREWASPAEAGAEMAKMGRYAGELAQEGKLQGGNPLKSMKEAARVRAQGGRRVVTDGPFAETKEMVGGFFLIEAASREEAVAIAGRCPHTARGPVEVREVMEVGGPPRP